MKRLVCSIVVVVGAMGCSAGSDSPRDSGSADAFVRERDSGVLDSAARGAPDVGPGSIPPAADAGPPLAVPADATPPAPAVDAAVVDCSCAGLPEGWRCIRAFNRCGATVWLEAQGNEAPEGVLDGRHELAPGACRGFALQTLEAGRLWGDTGCEDGTCDTAPGTTPVTLAELTLGATDFYDLSLVDGYNLPMSLAPVAGTFATAGGGPFDCGAPSCVADLNATCPAELARQNASGVTVACLSACAAFETDAYCCRGAHATPDTCPPTDYSRLFKAACPDAYSYAYDDAASTYTCHGAVHYDVTFCP